MNAESSPQSFTSLITELIDGHCRPTDLENIELAIAWESLDVVFKQDREDEPHLTWIIHEYL